MDAFTAEVAKLGVPYLTTGVVFQRPVANINVASNVPGIATGTGLAGGSIEFSSTNYSQAPQVFSQSLSRHSPASRPRSLPEGVGAGQVSLPRRLLFAAGILLSVM
jgi:sialate O-acetylesterase